MIYSKPLETITLEDIKDLKENQVHEDKNIDYKEILLGNSDGDKKEFLADVSSFANCNGGDIIFGIKEKRDEKNQSTGILEEIIGLEFNFDQEKQRLENIILDGIKPRIYISFWSIDFKDGKQLLIIRIPKSWNSPHLIEFQKSRKFFSRHSSGKYQLDIDEIRSGFIASDNLREKIRNFRIERINKIITGDTPITMEKAPKIALHVIPLISLSKDYLIDITSLSRHGSNLPAPLNKLPEHCDSRYNLEGFLRAPGYIELNHDYDSYLQIFRNGIIEIVRNVEFLDREEVIIAQGFFEKKIIEQLPEYLNFLFNQGIGFPIIISLTYIGVKNYNLGYRKRQIHSEFGKFPLKEDILTFPEVIIENDDYNLPLILKKIYDSMANATGFQNSYNYDENGWNGNWSF